jgi:hypothetical protein
MIEPVLGTRRASILATVLRPAVQGGQVAGESKANPPALELTLHHPQKTHPSTLLMILRNSTGGP